MLSTPHDHEQKAPSRRQEVGRAQAASEIRSAVVSCGLVARLVSCSRDAYPSASGWKRFLTTGSRPRTTRPCCWAPTEGPCRRSSGAPQAARSAPGNLSTGHTTEPPSSGFCSDGHGSVNRQGLGMNPESIRSQPVSSLLIADQAHPRSSTPPGPPLSQRLGTWMAQASSRTSAAPDPAA